jgi:hypothetical protein
LGTVCYKVCSLVHSKRMIGCWDMPLLRFWCTVLHKNVESSLECTINQVDALLWYLYLEVHNSERNNKTCTWLHFSASECTLSMHWQLSTWMVRWPDHSPPWRVDAKELAVTTGFVSLPVVAKLTQTPWGYCVRCSWRHSDGIVPRAPWTRANFWPWQRQYRRLALAWADRGA